MAAAQIGVRKFKITGVDYMRNASTAPETLYKKEDKTFSELGIISYKNFFFF